RRGDPRIHHEQALPAVEERDAPAPDLPQIDVEAARLGISGRQLAEGQGAGEDERAAGEPETEDEPRRAQRADQLRGGEEDADTDRVPDDERRRRPESELARGAAALGSRDGRSLPSGSGNTGPALPYPYPRPSDCQLPI